MKGFWEFMQAYSQEAPVLSRLGRMTPVQQVELDIALHRDAISKGTFGPQSGQLAFDAAWKRKLIEIFKGQENNPEIIKQTIDIIRNDINSHRGRQPNQKTGSGGWHDAWISVYVNWIRKLQSILGALHGT